MPSSCPATSSLGRAIRSTSFGSRIILWVELLGRKLPATLLRELSPNPDRLRPNAREHCHDRPHRYTLLRCLVDVNLKFNGPDGNMPVADHRLAHILSAFSFD